MEHIEQENDWFELCGKFVVRDQITGQTIIQRIFANPVLIYDDNGLVICLSRVNETNVEMLYTSVYENTTYTMCQDAPENVDDLDNVVDAFDIWVDNLTGYPLGEELRGKLYHALTEEFLRI